ncbi:MAG TPA: SGNH/GDSL hydrolase family protein [Burkholderiales bacterium]|nr:SGNH/GDSL hydrolase family protein [Burkholderiales bacterium]
MTARAPVRVSAALLAAASISAVAAPQCPARPENLALGAPLPTARSAVDQRRELEIVALGSSSTQGYGASTPLRSYPAELLRVLSHDLPGVKVTVHNKGIGGQDVSEMLQRLDRDVFAEAPDLVVWQLGTNAALRAQNVSEFRRLLGGGIDRLRARGIEVILMTPQYAPAFNALENEQDYLAAMDEIARDKQVAVFRRYRIMQDWAESDQMPFAAFLSRDGLHLNDFGYACIGRLLAQAIEQALGK